LEVHDPRPHLRDPVLGLDQRLAEALVEAARDLAHQLDVLALVLADRHLVRLVGENVSRLKHRIEKEPGGDELALLRRLLLELVHPVEVPVSGYRGQQPAKLGVLMHVGLAKQNATLRVEPRREQNRGRVLDTLAELGRVVVDRDRVQVDDAIERFAPLLPLHILANRADVVTEVLAAGGLDAREDAEVRHGRGI
jgi:hypothetical protein